LQDGYVYIRNLANFEIINIIRVKLENVKTFKVLDIKISPYNMIYITALKESENENKPEKVKNVDKSDKKDKSSKKDIYKTPDKLDKLASKSSETLTLSHFSTNSANKPDKQEIDSNKNLNVYVFGYTYNIII